MIIDMMHVVSEKIVGRRNQYRAKTSDLRRQLIVVYLSRGKIPVSLLQILFGHFGTRVGGSASVQSVAAGSAAQVDVFDL